MPRDRGIPTRCRKGGPGATPVAPLLNRLSPPILFADYGATEGAEKRGEERDVREVVERLREWCIGSRVGLTRSFVN